MYPNLYYAFQDLFGIELNFLKMFQSFGFFVAVSFLLASYFFAKELKRKEGLGLLKATSSKVLKGAPATAAELVTSAIIGFLLGYKLIYIAFNFSSFLEDTQGHLLSLDGSIFGGVVCAAVFAFYKRQEKEREKLSEPAMVEVTLRPHEHVGNMTLLAAVGGLLGAKIFHNLENWNDFMEDPIEQLLSFSGLTMYGGLIVGAVCVLWYARKNDLTLTHVVDACAPGLMLAYGTGRIGCHIAGDGDWGINNLAPKPGWMSFLPDWTWAYSYPHNVNSSGVLIPGCEGPYCKVLPHPVFPTPFYEAVLCIALFFVLWSLRKKITTPGVLFSLYLLLNGIERFLIEKIRVNNPVFGTSFTQAEIISFFLILTGIFGIWWFRKNKATPLST